MARKSLPILPGLSRSSACQRTKGCGRLVGHRGECRSTLTARAQAQSAKPTEVYSAIVQGFHVVVLSDGTVTSTKVIETRAYTKAGKRDDSVVKGVEVLSSDRYEVPSEPRTAKRRAARVVGQCRVTKSGVRCHRAYGHKQAGQRHAFATVTVVPEVTVDRSQTIVGKHSRRRNYVVSGAPSARLA